VLAISKHISTSEKWRDVDKELRALTLLGNVEVTESINSSGQNGEIQTNYLAGQIIRVKQFVKWRAYGAGGWKLYSSMCPKLFAVFKW